VGPLALSKSKRKPALEEAAEVINHYLRPPVRRSAIYDRYEKASAKGHCSVALRVEQEFGRVHWWARVFELKDHIETVESI
jgi:hypothetical protein